MRAMSFSVASYKYLDDVKPFELTIDTQWNQSGKQ